MMLWSLPGMPSAWHSSKTMNSDQHITYKATPEIGNSDHWSLVIELKIPWSELANLMILKTINWAKTKAQTMLTSLSLDNDPVTSFYKNKRLLRKLEIRAHFRPTVLPWLNSQSNSTIAIPGKNMLHLRTKLKRRIGKTSGFVFLNNL